MDLEQKIERLWSNPNGVNLNAPLVYQIDIVDDSGASYTYIGRGRNEDRLKEYQQNMIKIDSRKERGKTQKYRAVHFALYQAISNNWECHCFPVKNTTKENLLFEEGILRERIKSNLNGARGWRVADIENISLSDLIS